MYINGIAEFYKSLYGGRKQYGGIPESIINVVKGTRDELNCIIVIVTAQQLSLKLNSLSSSLFILILDLILSNCFCVLEAKATNQCSQTQ